MPDIDVLVVGAGPAGAVAALEAKQAAPELDVVLLERDRAVGSPVRCAEGVGDAGLREFANPDGADWAARKITRVIFQAPDDTEVLVAERGVGWILDRTRFDAHLAAEAAAAGAEVLVGAEATGMSRNGGGDGRWHVRVKQRGTDDVYRARIVIGADGVETMVGRWAGLDTRVPSRDMESCAQYVLQGIDCDPDAIYLQFGDRIAPGGYAWIFPKAVGVANVGLGLVALKTDGRNARQYLDAWVARRYPTAARTGYTVVIVHTTIKKTYAAGVLVAGDAAHMINPLSGGGITNAMKAGRLAGCTAATAIREGDTSERRLSRYHEAWMALLGEDHLKYYRIKQALESVDDASFNALARTVNKIPLEKRSIGRIFAHALIKHPQLIPVAARFFV